MVLIVQKYGGSSVATPERIAAVADRIMATVRAGNQVAVVVSAMGDTTDDLLGLADQVTTGPSSRELDSLLSAGERISSALLVMAIQRLGGLACSLSGDQAGVRTTATHRTARIVDIAPDRIRRELAIGGIPVVAGFQGVRPDTHDVTTLGRGGSDTTAVALAAVLAADCCEIYTDVDGVYTADPRVVPQARRLSTVDYPVMLELAAAGAKVLMARCVACAHQHGVRVHVRSSASTNPGTVVLATEDDHTAQTTITGIAHDRSVASVAITGVPKTASATAQILRIVEGTGVDIDMLAHAVSTAGPSAVDITFTASAHGLPVVLAALQARQDTIGFDAISHDQHVGKVSVVGAGVRCRPEITATLLEALASEDIAVHQLSMSELRLSALCGPANLDRAVRALHTAFGLDTPDRAVAHAGTGRWTAPPAAT